MGQTRSLPGDKPSSCLTRRIRQSRVNLFSGLITAWLTLGIVPSAGGRQLAPRVLPNAPASSAARHSQTELAAPQSTSAEQGTRCSPRADCYQLTARYISDKHVIEGKGSLRWTNRSQRPVAELYWHMYLNAFQSRSTRFFRSPFIRARSGRPLTSFGSIRFTRLDLSAPYEQPLLDALAAHSPNDPLDRTDIRLHLPKAIAPGQNIELEMQFESSLPSLVERTGWSKDFVLAGQWFPKLAVLENDGTWAHFSFHPFAEFYADFADYQVTLEVPANFVVAASGQRLPSADIKRCTPRRASDHAAAPPGASKPPPCPAEWTTHSFWAPNVHDFAWSAWPHFQRLAGPSDNPLIEVFYPPGHQRNAKVTLETTLAALPQFSQRFGPYPHKTLTIVHPPQHAHAAGGMEYPSLITTGGAWHSTYYSAEVPAVTVHELAHQWFQGALASNEARWPFLDEGLTSYAELTELDRQLGNCSALCLPGLKISARQIHRANLLGGHALTPVATSAEDFTSFGQLGSVVYSRTALLLQTLGEVYGTHRLDRALRTYALRHSGNHPTPNDLLEALAPLGPQAVSNARAALEQGATVDYRLSRLEAVRATDGAYHNRVEVERVGDLVFPVDILLETTEGPLPLRTWDGVERQHWISWTGQSPVVHAEVDPTQRVLVDDDLLNNAADAKASPSGQWIERMTYWIELSLLWLAL